MRDPSATITIVQDDRNPNNRIHRYDALHRAASAEVRQLSAAFEEKHKISAKNPMTVDQAKQLVKEIKTSNLPGISAHREAIFKFIRTRGIYNAARLGSRGGSE